METEQPQEQELQPQQLLPDEAIQYPKGPSLSDDAIKWQLEPLPVLNEMEYYLKGYDYNQEKGIWEKTGIQLMSDEGASMIIFKLRGVLNKNCVQGNLSASKLNKICWDADKTLILLLASKWYAWKIEKSNLDTIRFNVIRQVEIFLSRTVGDGERKRHNIQYHIGDTRIRSDSEEKKKKTFRGMLGG